MPSAILSSASSRLKRFKSEEASSFYSLKYEVLQNLICFACDWKLNPVLQISLSYTLHCPDGKEVSAEYHAPGILIIFLLSRAVVFVAGIFDSLCVIFLISKINTSNYFV